MSGQFVFELENVTFTVEYAGSRNVTPGYKVTAQTQNQNQSVASGYVTTSHLNMENCGLGSLEFYRPAEWLLETFDHIGADKRIAYLTSSGEYKVLHIQPPPEIKQGLRDWLVVDYTARLLVVASTIEAGQEPKDYKYLWYYELARAAKVDLNDAEMLTPQELVEDFRDELAERALLVVSRSGAATEIPLHFVWRGDVFLTLNQRVDTETWDNIKKYFTYFDQSFLEDNDNYGVPPGWYTTTEKASQVEELLAIPDYYRHNAIASRQASKAERQAQKDATRAQRRAEERAAASAAYTKWQEEHLAGLVKTTSPLPVEQEDWKEAYHAAKGTPGTWYTTGDMWYSAEVNGQKVYRCSYGNAVVYYAPQKIVEAACQVEWARQLAYFGEVYLTRQLLTSWENKTYDALFYKQMVEFDGLDYYVERARSFGEWLITGGTYRQDKINAAQKYNLPYVELETVKHMFGDGSVFKHPQTGQLYIEKKGSLLPITADK